MFLPKKYHDCYKEERTEEFKYGQPVVDDLVRFLTSLRKHFKKLSFDFMSCFYYDKATNKFMSHKDEYKSCIEADDVMTAAALVKFV